MPSLNVTVPVGIPPGLVTNADNVRLLPNKLVVELDSKAINVRPNPTVTVTGVLELDL